MHSSAPFTRPDSGSASAPEYVLEPAATEQRRLASSDAYSAALAYVSDRIDIQGDIFATLREWFARPTSGLRTWLGTALARLWRFWPESWYQSPARALRNIRFHYDHDPAFYRQFLDERLVYSCAYFERPDMTIHEAQAAKLDYICRKLDLKPGERFLDIGCGFGALVIRAAQRFRARAGGCTLSRRQFETAARAVREQDLESTRADQPRPEIDRQRLRPPARGRPPKRGPLDALRGACWLNPVPQVEHFCTAYGIEFHQYGRPHGPSMPAARRIRCPI